MAINFCCPIYKPKITSSTVSADGHEIDNLISGDFRRSCRGFMAESFIKPPITITLEFVCNIAIHSVVIAPSVGRQRSSSFEIYTKSIPSYKRSFNLDDDGNHGSNTGQTSKIPISPYDVTDVLVGKGFSQNPDINLFNFENKKFFAKEPFLDIAVNLTEREGNLITRPLHHHRSSPLANVSHVTIRIVRVLGTTLPCIKKLEVWGQPSFSNNQYILNSIVNIFASLKNTKESACCKKQEDSQDSAQTPSSVPSSSSENGNNCPEEFIDPITLEIMALPVLLPSGHTVDQSTLDRYEISNSQWGRAKADPFTGVPFSSTLKPIPHARLKTRIDKFLLTAGNEFDTVARTSGRSTANAKSQVSKITAKPFEKNDIIKHTPTSSTLTNHSNKSSSYAMTSKCKNTCQVISSNLLESNDVKKHSNEIHPPSVSTPTQQYRAESNHGNKSGSYVVTSKRKYACQVMSLNLQSKTTTNRNCNVTDGSTPSKVRKTEQVKTHEQKLADSLEEAMNSILATRPNYRKIDISNTAEPTGHVCISCQSQRVNQSVFYRLPCHHLMCRHCVTREGNNKCTTCGLAFNNFDIVRAHLT